MGWTNTTDYIGPDVRRIYGPRWVGYRSTTDLPTHAKSQNWVNFLAWMHQDGFNQKIHIGGRPPFYTIFQQNGGRHGAGAPWTDGNMKINHDEWYAEPWDLRDHTSQDLAPARQYIQRGFEPQKADVWALVPNPAAPGKADNPGFMIQAVGYRHSWDDPYCPGNYYGGNGCTGISTGPDMHGIWVSRRSGVIYQDYNHDYIDDLSVLDPILPFFPKNDTKKLKSGCFSVAKWWTKREVNGIWQHYYKHLAHPASGTEVWGPRGDHWRCYDGSEDNWSNQFFGATVAGAIPLAPFMVTYDEVARGAVKHLMAMGISDGASSWNWPMFGSDGSFTTPDPYTGTPVNKTINGSSYPCLAIPYGAVVRFKRNDTVRAKMKALKDGGFPLAYTVARAWQDYGCMPYDKSIWSDTSDLTAANGVFPISTPQNSGIGSLFQGDKRWPDWASGNDGAWAFENVGGFDFNDLEVCVMDSLMVTADSMEIA
jgi:hypothetical protein